MKNTPAGRKLLRKTQKKTLIKHAEKAKRPGALTQVCAELEIRLMFEEANLLLDQATTASQSDKRADNRRVSIV